MATGDPAVAEPTGRGVSDRGSSSRPEPNPTALPGAAEEKYTRHSMVGEGLPGSPAGILRETARAARM